MTFDQIAERLEALDPELAAEMRSALKRAVDVVPCAKCGEDTQGGHKEAGKPTRVCVDCAYEIGMSAGRSARAAQSVGSRLYPRFTIDLSQPNPFIPYPHYQLRPEIDESAFAREMEVGWAPLPADSEAFGRRPASVNGCNCSVCRRRRDTNTETT